MDKLSLDELNKINEELVIEMQKIEDIQKNINRIMTPVKWAARLHGQTIPYQYGLIRRFLNN